MATQETNNESDADRKCDHCNADNRSLFRCGGCKQLFYCNRKCQREAWKSGHKEICKYASELESIHKQISIEYELTSQNRKSKEITTLTPLQFKKSMLNDVICWFDIDKDKGLNFNEYQDLINNLSPKIVGKIIMNQTHDEKWTKWCDLCKKFGFDDHSSAILSKDEIWIVLVEIGTIAANLKREKTKNDRNKSAVPTGYQWAFHLLITLWSEVRDRLIAPIPKQEISDAVMCVTPLSRDITFIIYAYLSNIDAIFKIGSAKFPVEWEHDVDDTKPLHIMLQKYKEKASKKQEIDNDYINWDEDSDDKKDNNQYDKLYQYDVSYLRAVQEALDEDGTFGGVADGIEINVRIKDEFGVIDKEKKQKKYTFLLGSCLSAKIYSSFDLNDHAELISCVLKHHGLDAMNIDILYIGKEFFGPDVRREMQRKLVKIFNDINECNARWVNQQIASLEGIFSVDVYKSQINETK